LQVLANQIEQIEAAITALEKQLMAWHKTNPVSQRLASIPGIGPIIATAIATTVADPNVFRSGREFGAWLGLVPRQNLLSRHTRRREFITLLGGAAAVCFGSALAQQPSRVWRIGILHGVPQEASGGVAAFRQRLGELGYLEGQNTTIEYRWSDQADRLPLLTAALTDMKVDIIVVGDGTTATAAKQGTREIPIVAAAFTHHPVAPLLA